MKHFHPKYIVDSKENKKSVILPIEEWEEIMLAMEELDDIRVYDKAKKDNDEIIPFAQAIREIDDSEQ